MVVFVLLFIMFFEISSGPITWLYMSEIMQDKSLSIATFLNWTINLIISLILPIISKGIPEDKPQDYGWIFVVCSGLSIAGLAYIILLMKETRNKTAAEIEEMYASGTKGQTKN